MMTGYIGAKGIRSASVLHTVFVLEAASSMAAYIDNIVNPTTNTVAALIVASCYINCKIEFWVYVKVDVHATLIRTPTERVIDSHACLNTSTPRP